MTTQKSSSIRKQRKVYYSLLVPQKQTLKVLNLHLEGKQFRPTKTWWSQMLWWFMGGYVHGASPIRVAKSLWALTCGSLGAYHIPHMRVLMMPWIIFNALWVTLVIKHLAGTWPMYTWFGKPWFSIFFHSYVELPGVLQLSSRMK